MATLKRLRRRQRALATVHRLLIGEERMIARQLAECRSRQQQEEKKLSNLQDYYAEYLQAMRDAQGAQSSQVQERVRQQQFLTRLQTVIEKQQLEVQAINGHTARAAQLWATASRRADNMGDQLTKTDRNVVRQHDLASERQAEEESEQRRMFSPR